jgi:AraC family transcriptional activator of pobA
MAKRHIPLLQMNANRLRLAIFPSTDPAIAEHLAKDVVFPHRHDHYCCFFKEGGEWKFNLDFQSLDIPDSSLLVSCPGQVHELAFSKDLTGWVIAFDAGFIDENARMVIEQSFSKAAPLRLDLPDKQWFNHMFQLIQVVVNDHKPANFSQQLLQSLVSAFFYRIVNIYQAREHELASQYSVRGIEIAKQFHQLVKAHYFKIKKPADYASMLHITVSYLNDTVKSVTGFTSTFLIRQEVLREAQRLLFYTGKSVKEIAFQLGYDDHKYFIRLFSKTVGTSPAQFRKSSRTP